MQPIGLDAAFTWQRPGVRISPGPPLPEYNKFIFLRILYILMRSLNIGIFHDESLAKELGKKGSETDILMFNRKKDDLVMTFMYPLKLIPKIQIMSIIDIAIISLDEITPEFGETVLLIDALGITKGFLVVSKQIEDAAKSIIKGTAVENFQVIERDSIKIIQELEKIVVDRDIDSPSSIIIDQSFNVKGIGTVVLGFVKRGTIKKHDALRLLPCGKSVVIRSIQIHDKDYECADAGTRIGAALKGVDAEEIRRGFILSSVDVEVSQKFKIRLKKNKFYPEMKRGPCHMVLGMQSAHVEIIETDGNDITLKLEKPVAYDNKDKIVLIDLNAKKLHFIGVGEIIS